MYELENAAMIQENIRVKLMSEKSRKGLDPEYIIVGPRDYKILEDGCEALKFASDNKVLPGFRVSGPIKVFGLNVMQGSSKDIIIQF